MSTYAVMIQSPETHAEPDWVSSQHFAGLDAAMATGMFKMGGAIMNDVPEGNDPNKWSFAGSTIVAIAESKEEIIEVLKKDIYTESGVWDIENVRNLAASCASDGLC